MANRIQPGDKTTLIKLNLSGAQRAILETIGNGSITHGTRVAIDWAGHFFNCGLDPDTNLNYVGLVTTLPDDDDA